MDKPTWYQCYDIVQIMPTPDNLVLRYTNPDLNDDTKHWDDDIPCLALVEHWQCTRLDCYSYQDCDREHVDRIRLIEPTSIDDGAITVNNPDNCDLGYQHDPRLQQLAGQRRRSLVEKAKVQE